MGMSEKVAYLRGLADGMGLAQDPHQGVFITELINTIESLGTEIDRIHEQQRSVDRYLDEVDQSIFELENEVFEYDDEDEACALPETFFGENPMDTYMETDCPHCGETVAYFDDPTFIKEASELICPHCEEVVMTFDHEDEDLLSDEGLLENAEELK